MGTDAQNPVAQINRPLRWLFCGLVLSLALYQFSENTTDPDLWLHTMLGRECILSGQIEKVETRSWTARGLPFINHEVFSQIVIGGSHLLAGGSGILLLKILVGFLTVGIALRLAGEQLRWPQRAVAWAVALVAVVEISYGFSARPQIFTAAFLAFEFWLLRRIQQGRHWWALVLPVLFGAWMNFHGGVLAGLGLLILAAVATTGQLLWNRFSGKRAPLLNAPSVSKKAVATLWLAIPVCAGALFINPWGTVLVRWIVEAALWPRPQIEEWNPATLGWDHAVFFILVVLAVVSFALSRRLRDFWEMTACAALAWQAGHAVRHTPLFCIAALAFVPPHLADALMRFREHFSRIEELYSRRSVQRFLGVLLGALSLAILGGAFSLHKEHPLTMEVPANRYPLAAVDFIRRHGLHGNTLSFFDWGEMCLWELPECFPSMDARMDDCYPREFIKEHWAFYNGQPYNRKELDPGRADLALLPANLAGAAALAREPGWQAVYVDDLAVVLVRDPRRFPKLPTDHLPVQGGAKATMGSVCFPDGAPRGEGRSF